MTDTMPDTALETLLRRDRAIVAASLAMLAALAWAYILWLAATMDMGGMAMPEPGMGAGMDMDMDMDNMGNMDMSNGPATPLGTLLDVAPRPWTAVEAGITLTMWIVMMVGMMLPSATPMVLLYARVGRQSRT